MAEVAIGACGLAEEVRAVIGLAGQYAAVDENLTGRENLRLIGQLTHQPRSAIAARAEQLLGRVSRYEADRMAMAFGGPELPVPETKIARVYAPSLVTPADW